ncbi:MAG: hypothetical protein WC374_02480 [Phycisphaerae bacterium]|jgi:hypothetical protein
MGFRYESEMTKPVENWLLAQGLLVKREYPTPWGICDLVGCSYNKNKVRKRLNYGQKRPIGSQFRVLLLSYIPDMEEKEAINFTELHRQFASFLDASFVEKELSKLVKDKFVEEVEAGCFHKLNGWYPIHKRIVAVELKLSRISEVLAQARNNLAFAEETYVGLPINKAKDLFENRKERQLIERGVGILGINRDKVQVLLRSKSSESSDFVLKMHCAERFWKDALKDILA